MFFLTPCEGSAFSSVPPPPPPPSSPPPGPPTRLPATGGPSLRPLAGLTFCPPPGAPAARGAFCRKCPPGRFSPDRGPGEEGARNQPGGSTCTPPASTPCIHPLHPPPASTPCIHILHPPSASTPLHPPPASSSCIHLLHPAPEPTHCTHLLHPPPASTSCIIIVIIIMPRGEGIPKSNLFFCFFWFLNPCQLIILNELDKFGRSGRATN